MSKHEEIINRCLDDIDVLIASPQVGQFLVGYTSDLESRRKSYIRIGIPQVFAIATQLQHEEALDIEKALFERCVAIKSSRRYLKYHIEKRDSKYIRSAGGVKPAGASCVVYVASFSA